jgi:hypothetical protein
VSQRTRLWSVLISTPLRLLRRRHSPIMVWSYFEIVESQNIDFLYVCFCFVDEVDVGALSSRSPKASRCNECYAVVIFLNLTFFAFSKR